MGADLDNSHNSRPHTTELRPKLRREVLYPQRQNTGVGVMLVASAAMFFAVASSAFILRAQMPMQECPGDAQRFEAVPVDLVPVELIDAETVDETLRAQRLGDALSDAVETCGDPIYQDNPDGSVSVFFDLCPRSSVTATRNRSK